MAKKKRKNPIHPGEILLEEFLEPMGISQYRLAKSISVPARRINEIIHGKRAITADTALRFAKFFKMEPLFWMNLQIHYDLELASDKLGTKIKNDIEPFAA
jgi:antitoxin HigA-1